MSATRALRRPALGGPRFGTVSPTALELLLAVSIALVLGAVAVKVVESSTTIAVFLLLAATLPFVAILMGGLQRLLLGIAILNISFNWDINFAYDYEAASRGAVGGLNFSLTTIALVGLFALWLAEVLAKPESEDSPRLPLRWIAPGALYVALTGLALLAAHDRQLSVFELALLLQGFLLFLYIAAFVRTERDVRFVVGALVLALVLQGVLIVAARYFGVDLQLAGLSTRTDVGDERSRFAGTLGGPNGAGSFLAPTLVLAISVFIARARESRHRLAPLAIALGAVALIQTFSRGAWVAFALAIVVLLAVMTMRGMISRRILGLAAFAAVAALVFGGTVAERFTRDGTETVEARASLFDTSVEVIRDYPFLGVGPNNFAIVLPSYRELTGYAYIPHNRFALVWAEAGIGALLAFVALVLVLLRRSWLAVRTADRTMFPYAVGVMAAFLALCVHMNFEPFNGQMQGQLFWLLAGLVTALWGMRRQDAGEAVART
jgi:putative inorganic carbon (HCO3(-)) transporter